MTIDVTTDVLKKLTIRVKVPINAKAPNVFDK